MNICNIKSETNTVYLNDTFRIELITNIQNCIDRSSSVKTKQQAIEKCNIVRYHDNDTKFNLRLSKTFYYNNFEC